MQPQAPSFDRPFIHRLWRTLPAGLRRNALARLTAALVPRPGQPAGPAVQGIAIAGEFSRASGLGEGARLMAAGARSLGVQVWMIDLPPPVDARQEVTAEPDTLPPPGIPLILHVNAPTLPLALLRLPRAVTRGRPVIGYWAWELQQVPPEWRPAAGCVSEIWAPSGFTAAALEPLAPGRVRVVPPPLAVIQPLASAPGRAAFGLPRDAVVVLVSFNLASAFARKHPFGALAAFHGAFGDRPDRVLVMKISHADHAPQDFARLAAMAQGPNIRLETRTLPSADNRALTACADIVLSLHRAEGFGLVMAEAMLLGKPVIATGWSGNTDFMDEANAALIGHRLIPARDTRSVYHGHWAEPDITEAAERLRALADDPALRLDLGQRAWTSALARLDARPLAAALRGIGVQVPQ